MNNLRSTVTLIVLVCFGLFVAPSAEAALFTNGGTPPFGGYQCMDVAGGGTAAFTPVQAWPCHGWVNQQFTMQGTTIYTVGSSGGAQNCLDVQWGATAAGTPVGIYPCHGGPAQKWYYYNGKLYYMNNTSLCLDAGNRQNGTRLVVNYCTNVSSQQWQIK